MENQKSVDELEFVRLRIPSLIPHKLIEAVKGRTFSPEQFYEYQEMQKDNPNNYLYALIDKTSKIHGYLWAESNLLDGSLFINTFSISKEYWGKGKTIERVSGFLRKLKAEIGADRVFWVTTNSKFFLKHGFRLSKNILMEYVDESAEKPGSIDYNTNNKVT